MNAEDSARLGGLLLGQRLVSLGVVVDGQPADPLQVPRVQLEGVVGPLQAGRPEREPAARAFLHRFPQAATTLPLPDFTLHRLEIRGGRMVLGFGRALKLSTSHFRDLPKGQE